MWILSLFAIFAVVFSAQAAGPARTEYLGIDIGGTHIKGSVIDIINGTQVTKTVKFDTPHPGTPRQVVAVIKAIIDGTGYDPKAAFGVTFPSIVRHGVVSFRPNHFDASWMGVNAEKLFSSIYGAPCVVMNDGDAAAVAEVAFGAGRDLSEPKDLILMITLGTGVGAGLVHHGKLVSNFEISHIHVNATSPVLIEIYCAGKVKDEEGLTFPEFADRLTTCFNELDFLVSPDAIIVGGGISAESDKFLPLVKTRPVLVVAETMNKAGRIGAAYLAAEL